MEASDVPKGFWEVVYIEAVKADNGFYQFTVVLDGPPGVVRVLVPWEALLDYSIFQREVLARAADLYSHYAIEGRDYLSANRQWMELVDVWLRRWQETQPAVAQTQESAGSTLN